MSRKLHWQDRREQLESAGQEDKSWLAKLIDTLLVQISAQGDQLKMNEMPSDWPFKNEGEILDF